MTGAGYKGEVQMTNKETGPATALGYNKEDTQLRIGATTLKRRSATPRQPIN